MGVFISIRIDTTVQWLERAILYFTQRIQHSIFDFRLKMKLQVLLTSNPPVVHLTLLQSSFEVATACWLMI